MTFLNIFSGHARKFASCNRLPWSPASGDFVPPEQYITNDNMEEFFCQCWEDGSKPNVTQGRRYINHILTHHGQSPMNKNHRQKYASVLDVIKGLEKQKKWREHKSDGAKPLPLDYVKSILCANIKDANDTIDLMKLRNKALASALLLCGWHPGDAWKVPDKNVINLENFHDRDGHHRPKFLFNDLTHNKREQWKVYNTIGCGCKGQHDPKNEHCPYNVILWYTQTKEEHDGELFKKKNRISRKERLRHFDEQGFLSERAFFRSITKKTGRYEHRNMGIGAIRGVLEYWRVELDLGGTKLTTDMARKTFCTLGVKCARKKIRRTSRSPTSNSWTSPTTAAPTSSRRTSSTLRGATRRPRLTRDAPSRSSRRDIEVQSTLHAARHGLCARCARAHDRDQQERVREHPEGPDRHQESISLDSSGAQGHQEEPRECWLSCDGPAFRTSLTPQQLNRGALRGRSVAPLLFRHHPGNYLIVEHHQGLQCIEHKLDAVVHVRGLGHEARCIVLELVLLVVSLGTLEEELDVHHQRDVAQRS